ncbi:hypothetical protein R3P38DRAFT_1783772 [Favolaschia claudopus]|uniref:Uncharacterized protein n=1 Tax=Favolaschia claudopus TaxID=2862362 RepID=A0AAW0A6Z6_9AGAR
MGGGTRCGTLTMSLAWQLRRDGMRVSPGIKAGRRNAVARQWLPSQSRVSSSKPSPGASISRRRDHILRASVFLHHLLLNAILVFVVFEFNPCKPSEYCQLHWHLLIFNESRSLQVAASFTITLLVVVNERRQIPITQDHGRHCKLFQLDTEFYRRRQLYSFPN